jgi:probable H4MPT-linked C1 transfer pathway protein
MPVRDTAVIGWDIGGAHVKAARLERGEFVDAAQWPCPLWQGLPHLEHVLASAASRWPDLARARHAVTMTGEMVDLFANREDGVRRIAALLAAAWPSPRFFAGDAGWCSGEDAGDAWRHIASANWLASARHSACTLRDAQGLLVDIGSTTTDIVAFAQGRVLSASRGDAQRLEHGELVYQGVVRTPLCALAQRIAWRGRQLNVMNEFFATTADVYRTTGELDPAHDQQPSADHGGKDAAATCARLARMIGLDGRDGSAEDWLAFARAWRTAQCVELRAQVSRVIDAHRFVTAPLVVAAGCGAFLVPEIAAGAARCLDYGRDVARVAAPDVAAWARVAAPALAVAALYAGECI